MGTHRLIAWVNRILLRLDMQSDRSPHFLRVRKERPMYHSTSSPRTSRSPCEELSGPRRGPSEIGSPTSTRNPMAGWQMRTKRPLREPVREEAGPTLKNYITPAGLQRLKDEHLFLLSRERPAVVEVVAWAASNGDRSENADYLYGKRRLGQIDSRIRLLTKRIDAAVVVDPAAPRSGSAATRVFFGATVTYKDAAGLEHVVSIVGIDEVDLDRGYISWPSPLPKSLMKSTPTDPVDLRAPAKTDHLEIIEVEYAPIPMDPFPQPLGAQSTPKVEGS